jgi:acyl carrier protein
MYKKLEKLFNHAFGIDKIDNSISIDNVDGWDSIAHVALIMELQKEFKVSISPADAVELTSVEKIIEYLKKNAKK